MQSVELDPIAAATHERNLRTRVDVSDVRMTQPVGRCDVLIAGPPCQGFSSLGKRDQNDQRNGLCLEVARWARVLRPTIVVVENVAPFIDSPAWAELRRRFRRIGYQVEAVVIDAVDYGVPQFRRRSFTFASHVGMPELRKTRPHLSVRRAWKGLPSRPNGRNAHYAPAPSSLALMRMQSIPPGGDKRDVLRHAPHLAPPSWHATTSEVTDVWGRLDWDEPSNTLRTCLLNPSKGRYIHPTQHRVISLREAARLHSIPDSWGFVGTPYQVARQIGNSVPPALGRAVARGIRRLLRF